MEDFGFLEAKRRIFAVIPRRRKVQGIAVLFLMLAGALAELMTIGTIVPFLAIVSDPTYIQRHETLRFMLELLGVSDGPRSTVQLATLFCVVVFTAAAVRITLVWASQKYVFKIGFDLGAALYTRVLSQPYTFHVQNHSMNTVSAMNKVQQVITQSMMPIMQALSSTVIAIFILGGLLALSASASIAAIGVLGSVYMLVSLFTRKRLRRNGQIISQAGTARMKSVQEGLGAIRDVILDQSQPIYLSKYLRIDRGLRDAQATNALIAASPRFGIEALGMITIALLALYLGRQNGGLANALPVLGALALGSQRLLPLMQQTYNGFTSIAGNKAILASVLRLLDLPPPADDRRGTAIKPLPFTDEIAFNEVEYRYTKDGAHVLRDISLRIAKGARVGFVGKTGSGKSTTLDLLMGLLVPTGGTITVDKVPLSAANLAGWQIQIAHVPQQIFLSDATLLENIAFGVPDAEIDFARVEDAAQRADIHDYILEQPLGYCSRVGERGVRLSGGQRQRIGIARALYKQSTLLILDEATSALDDRTEASIMQSIEKLGDDITVLMIAHRLTTLRTCDTVFRLSEGRIEASGTYEEVIGSELMPVGDGKA